jgi:hypothetical protein
MDLLGKKGEQTGVRARLLHVRLCLVPFLPSLSKVSQNAAQKEVGMDRIPLVQAWSRFAHRHYSRCWCGSSPDTNRL